MIDDLGPFWDDATLCGDISLTSSRRPINLFDDVDDLFADAATLDEVVPAPDEDTPPFMLHPPSPPLSNNNNNTWRTFLDDNCPFRRRVKVTINNSNNKRVIHTANAEDTKQRKRARTTLQFPPQFSVDAPLVPRRTRACAPEPDIDLLIPLLPELESDAPVMLDADGVRTNFSPCAHDGYLTPKLQNRLAHILTPSDVTSVMSTSRVSSYSTGSSFSTASRNHAKLPCVSTAVAAVRQAATTYFKLVNTEQI